MRRKYFRNLWLGSVISGFGNELGEAAVLWMVLGVTHSAAALGLISLCRGVPAAIANPFAGVLGDRYSRPRLMVVGNILLGVVYVAIVIIGWLGMRWFWATYILIAIGAVISPLTITGRSQLIAELLPQEERTPANFFDEIYLHLTWLIGPAVAGFSVAWFGFGTVLIIDAATFFICSGFLLFIPSSLHIPGTSVRQLSRNLADGIKRLARESLLLQLAGLTLLFNLFFGVYSIALPLLTQQNFHGPQSYGLLWTAFALGSFIGGIFFSRREWKYPIGLSMTVIIFLWGLMTMVLSGAHHFWTVFVVMVVNGLVYTPYEPLYRAVIQQVVPMKLQAKVSSSIRPITGLGQPLGSWISGVAAHPIGIAGMFLSSGIATMAVGVLTFVLRRYDGIEV